MVLLGHANDQLLNLSLDPRPAWISTRLRAIEFVRHQHAVPGEESVRRGPGRHLGKSLASVFMLTQALLGFQPDAPRNKLYVDPSLPYWLPDLTVRDLRIGKHKLDIRFWTEGDATAFEVLKG